MENISQYIRFKNSCLLNSNYTFEDLFHIIHDQEDRVFCEFLHNYQVKKFTYKEMKDYCYKMASFLEKDISSTKGSFVGIHAENSLNWIGAFWALLMLGYKPLLLNCKLPIALNLEIIEELDVKTVVCTSDLFDQYDLKVIKLDAGLKPSNEVLGQKIYKPEKWEDFISLSTTATTQNYKICIYSGKDISHQVLNTKNIVALNPMIRETYKGQIKQLCFLPFYHIFGLVATYLWFSVFGRVFVFLKDYSSETILKTIRRHEVTHIFAVPLLWNTITREVRKSVASLSMKEQKQFEKGLKLSHKLQNISPRLGLAFAKKMFERVTEQTLGDSIKFMISGGGYISQDSLYLLNGIGYPLYNGYGSTEVGITSVELRKKAKYRVSGSIGRPFTSAEYKVVDGVLKVKGSSMCSYIIPRNGSKYAVDKDQWFDSNDNASIGLDGYYYILGRADDVVIDATGEKINPDVIERDLSLTTVNNYCVMDYQNELSFIFEVPSYTNVLKLNLIYEEIKNAVKQISKKGYKISKVYYTNDSMINKNAIKVSRKLLKNKIFNGEVTLLPFNEMLENTSSSNLEVSSAVLEIVKTQFALILGRDIDEIDCKKHFIFELGGSSLDYCTLLIKLKKEFEIELDFEEQNCSTVEEFSLFISDKLNGGNK